MTFALRSLCAVLAASCLSSLAADPVAIKEAPGKLSITIAGKPFADYVYEGYSRPFLFPLLGPGGLPMTRNWPLKEGVPNEEQDHPHHKSFWWAHGAMNGVDFWSESKEAGKTVHDGFLEVKSGERGLIKTKNKYLSKEGKVICTDRRVITIHASENPRIFDFHITLEAGPDGLLFGDTKEGTMSVRLAETMRVKGKVAKGHIITSEGVKDADTWGKRAKWVDYYGPVEDKIVGIAIFDHPANLRHPTWWHVRDYGLFGANPFGIHDFEKKEKGAGDLKLGAGETISFNYRFILHEGDASAAKIAQAYEKYISE